jgi:hypothetical protein
MIDSGSREWDWRNNSTKTSSTRFVEQVTFL